MSRTDPVKLNILPIPQEYTGKNWLPAENLVIEAEILEDPASIKTGEAITRHVVVRATGLLGSQLPALNIPSSTSIKTYPDKESLNSQLLNDKVVGSRRDTIAIIPLKEGSFILPEIKIDWWNLKTQQQETAILKEQILIALKNLEIQSETVNTMPAEVIDNEKQPETFKETIEKIVYKDIKLTKNIWFWISMALLFIWIITLILLIISTSKNNSARKKSVKHNNSKVKNEEHAQLLESLQVYCQNNDAHSASDALVYWAQFYFNKPSLAGLSQIIELIEDNDLINEINTLESSQYSADKKIWSGSNLSLAIIHFIKQDRQKKKSLKDRQQGFTPLNP